MTRRRVDDQRLGAQHDARSADVGIGRQVRLRRLLLGLSQAQLASSLSVSPQQVALIERGTSQLHASQLYLLSRALDTPVEFFFLTLDPATTPSSPSSAPITTQTPQNPQGGIDLDPDGRSNQEMKRIVEAFSRIPRGEHRLRILRIVQGLSEPNDITETDPF